MPRLHVVFGAYDSGPRREARRARDLHRRAAPRGRARWAIELVKIRSTYRDRSTKDPHHAKHDDIYAKMVSVMAKLRENKHSHGVALRGAARCPLPSRVLFLCLPLGDLKNPFLDARESIAFNKAYLQWRSVTALRRLQRDPVSEARPVCSRAAKPDPSVTPPEPRPTPCASTPPACCIDPEPCIARPPVHSLAWRSRGLIRRARPGRSPSSVALCCAPG